MLSFLRKKRPSDFGPSDAADAAACATICESLGLPSRLALRRGAVVAESALGRGAFGSVYRCTVGEHSRIDGEPSDAFPAAAKVVKLSRLSPKDRPLLQNELVLWAAMDHPHIVKLHGACLHPSEYVLVCELMSTSLRKCLEDDAERGLPPLGLRGLATKLRQVASAVAHMHARRVIHRDIKADNVLVDESGRLAVSDLGLARVCEGRGLMTAETGSYRWMAPEVIRHEAYDASCDVYSFAILAWEVLARDVPYGAEYTPVEAALAVATQDIRPALPRHCPAPVAALISRCWRASPDERPSFAVVVASLDGMLAPRASSAPPAPAAAADATVALADAFDAAVALDPHAELWAWPDRSMNISPASVISDTPCLRAPLKNRCASAPSFASYTAHERAESIAPARRLPHARTYATALHEL